MTDTNDSKPSQESVDAANSARRLVNDGVCDVEAAVDHVTAEQHGRDIARRLNARRLSAQPESPK